MEAEFIFQDGAGIQGILQAVKLLSWKCLLQLADRTYFLDQLVFNSVKDKYNSELFRSLQLSQNS